MVTTEHAVGPKPPGVSFDEAATLTGTFFTAYYSLEHLARLQPGERVLVHGGAGGVGLATIQLATARGCEVFATAGSDEKRDFLRLLGVPHVLDSRSLTFAQEIEVLTEGEGVDVVLNSLAGEAINRSLSVLRPFGRFIELGKRDFFADTRVGLRPFRNNISYFGVDADQLFAHQPNLASRLYREVLELFAEGSLRPLIHRVFRAREVVEAFRYLQQSRHMGKVVIATQDLAEAAAPAPSPPPALELREDGTYLVVGGTPGFGLETARFLARRGAGHLALLSRRGPDTPGVAEAAGELEEAGCRVHVLAADAGDREALAAALAQLAEDAPPLRGLVHSAMVLEDDLLENQDRERFHRVMAPKLVAARNLDDLTRELPLDFFVLYSSATTAFGNPGQANYVAANIYLEALAEARRRDGLPALAIGWGAIADAGVLTRDEELRELLQDRGGDGGLTAADALAALERALGAGIVAASATRMDWGRLARLLDLGSFPRLAGFLRRTLGAAGEQERDGSFLAGLEGLDEAARGAAVMDLVQGYISEILQWPLERIDVDQPTLELGLDSLMAVELRALLERDLEITLTPALLGQANTIRQLSQVLAGRLGGAGGPEPGADPVVARAQEVEAMLQADGVTLEPEEVREIAARVEGGTSPASSPPAP